MSIALVLSITVNSVLAEERPEIPPEVLHKLEELRKGELNQLEKIKLADELQRAGAKSEAIALYQENLPVDGKKNTLPSEAYLNYGTALLEKGEEKKGLEVYDALNSSLDPQSPKTQKIKEMMDKNVVNFFQVQEQKKQQEKKEQKENKENKENKDKQDQKDGQSGESGSEKKEQKGSDQNPQNQKDKKEQGKDSKDQKEKEKEDADKEQENREKEKEKEKKPQDGGENKLPPPKMSPKLKQLMSDDRQLQLKVIEQGTRDMNRRNSRENKDW
jgi:Ca-activated chloride channel family protein